MAASLKNREHQQEQSSAMINSTTSELKEFTQKTNGVEKKLEKLECKVLQIENKVSDLETIFISKKMLS